jgi:hypothetical protein
MCPSICFLYKENGKSITTSLMPFFQLSLGHYEVSNRRKGELAMEKC